MSELLAPVPANILDILQEGCRNCPFGRNLIHQAIKNGLDGAEEAKRINKECPEWMGEQSPQEALLSKNPALAVSESIEEHCAHPIS